MNDIKMTNIPSMAVDKMVNQLSEAYSTVINNGTTPIYSRICLRTSLFTAITGIPL